MAMNSNLHAAKGAKNDEFYTLYREIEKELVNYEDQLRDKVVYCNCDDVRYSNFFEYMCRVAPHIGIRKVIGSHYDKGASQSYYVTFVPPPNLDHWDGDNWERYLIEMPMEGDGDFRSEASIRLLRQADIVITNPPFSCIREFIAQLMEYNKKFLFIGQIGIAVYKEIFPLIKDNKLWLGYNTGNMWFKIPNDAPYKTGQKEENGIRYQNIGAIVWFTNLNVEYRNRPQELFLSYERRDREYPKYDNYDAINVDKVIEVPKDFYGVIGVPCSWLRYYCPEQFEIIGSSKRGCHEESMETRTYDDYWEMKQDGTRTGCKGSKTNGNPNLLKNDNKHNYFINNEGRIVQSCFNRIFIRRRQQE